MLRICTGNRILRPKNKFLIRNFFVSNPVKDVDAEISQNARENARRRKIQNLRQNLETGNDRNLIAQKNIRSLLKRGKKLSDEEIDKKVKLVIEFIEKGYESYVILETGGLKIKGSGLRISFSYFHI